MIKGPPKVEGLIMGLLALLGGGLFSLSLAPVDWWPLSFLSVMLLFHLSDSAAPGKSAWLHYCYGVGFYCVGTSWFFVSIHDHGGASTLLAASLVLLFALALALFFALQGYLAARFLRSWSITGFACLWFMREWLMTWIFTGFPWLLFGYSLLDTWFENFAPVIGVLALSFIGVLISASLVKIMRHLAERSYRESIVPLVMILVVVGLGWMLQFYQPVQPTGKTLTVSLIQGNTDQHTKWSRAMVMPIIERYTSLSEQEWGRDLIVWPEASITVFRAQAGPLLESLDARGRAAGSALLLGIPDRDEEGHFLNSATVVGEGEGVYHKRRLVPFGEYVPLEFWLRGMIQFFDLPMSRNVPGAWEQPPLTIQGQAVSLSICYEVVYPELVRSSVESPRFFVTISNDTWFGSSIGPWQHLQMARMRALENGRYMVRATNNGVTAVIDERGKIRASLPQFEEGVLRGDIADLQGTTPYSRIGHLVWVLLIGSVLLWIGYSGRSYQGNRSDIARVQQ